MGPPISAAQRDKVSGYVDIGRDEGARVIRGRAARGPGAGVRVLPGADGLADVDSRMRVAQEEIFGPVAALIPFDDEEDAVFLSSD